VHGETRLPQQTRLLGIGDPMSEHTHDQVTISLKEYNELKLASEELDALNQGGVDNWDWCSESIDAYIKANPNSLLAKQHKEDEDDGA
jgi:hypothetical protein